MYWLVFVGLAIALVIVLYFTIKQQKRHNDDIAEIKGNIPVIEESEKKARKELALIGIKPTKSYSSAGYKFFEYKSKYNMPDNFHIVFDDEAKKIVCYSYLPYNFEVFSYSDLIGVHYLVNEENDVSFDSLDSAIKYTSEEITAFAGLLEFKNANPENVYGISFINNAKCNKSDSVFGVVLGRAKEFGERAKTIINTKPKKSKV